MDTDKNVKDHILRSPPFSTYRYRDMTQQPSLTERRQGSSFMNGRFSQSRPGARNKILCNRIIMRYNQYTVVQYYCMGYSSYQGNGREITRDQSQSVLTQHNIIRNAFNTKPKQKNMRDFKLRQSEMKEKVALLNDTAIELQERDLKKEVEFHFFEAYTLLKELARDHEEIALTSKRTPQRLIPLSDQTPAPLSNIGSSCPRLAQPIFVRDLALGSSTRVPTLAVVIMYNIVKKHDYFF
jgi:uncharacterized membrane-anchored protein YhcB (DUF1043 family)